MSEKIQMQDKKYSDTPQGLQQLMEELQRRVREAEQAEARKNDEQKPNKS